MRRLTLAAGAACAVVLIGPLGAQNSNDFTMPGQIVGGFGSGVTPVGNRAPSAAPAAGLPVGQNALQRPFDPNRPFDQFKGTGIDPALLRAPLVGPDGREVAPPGPLSDFLARVKAVFVKNPPPPDRTIPYAPGISRRNRDRVDQRMWRRD